MKRLTLLCITLLWAYTLFAQSENSIIINASTFRPVQTDALTGVNIDPIGTDASRRPCARLKVKINRMTKSEIDGIEVKLATNNQLIKNITSEYDMGLILEMTAKPQTRFYFHHNEFGDSNEVCIDLEANKEYYIEAYLNQQYPITVSSNIDGADVYLDNIFKGRTGIDYVLVIKDVIPGIHTLKVEYGGVKSESQIVVNSGNVFFRQPVNIEASRPQFVVFAVEPQSAVVTIDGKHYSLTDGAMRLVLESGTYNYTVSAAGYHSQSGTFTVAGSKVTKQIALTADAATVTLTVADNAEIWVNGEKVGNSRWSGTLNSGTYIFEAKKAGHSTTTTSKHITSDNPQQSYTLDSPKPLFGSLIVDGSPLMADVTIDGVGVGQMPLSLDNLLVGEHKITVSKSGYQPYTTTVTIAEGRTATVSAALKKQTTQTSSSSGKIYKVGDYYNENGKEGVVFDVSADGKSGKIVSMGETFVDWTTDGKERSRIIGASSTTDGAYNMTVVKSVPDWEEKYPNFKWCANLGEGWYLPAIEELKLLILDNTVYNAVNRTLAANKGTLLANKETVSYLISYLSSTEENQKSNNEYKAWHVFVKSGYTLDLGKGRCGAARAVATFGDVSNWQQSISGVKTYKVGDYYNENGKQGVVIEVREGGSHGKIVSMTQTELPWSDKSGQGQIIGANSNINGAYNMSIITAIPKWEEKYHAFKWCADLGEDWYLPTPEDLRTIYRNKKIINSKLTDKILDESYWSSREDSKNKLCADFISMSNGDCMALGKVYYQYVRAVANF